MNAIFKSIKNFVNDEQGATAIEYGLMVALVSLAIVTGAALLGTNLGLMFTHISTCIATPTAALCHA